MDNLNEKRAKTTKDLEDIEEALSEVSSARNALKVSESKIADFYVFDENVYKTDLDLRSLRKQVESAIEETKVLTENLRDKYRSYQQLVPSDLSQELTNLELLVEGLLNKMDEKEREFKKARTVRSDYLTDVEEVQNWIKDAELKVQDRSIEPQALSDHLQQVSAEMGPVCDKLERLVKNGKAIMEKSRSEEEKKLIRNTIDGLCEQMQQVKSWLEEKKQQVGDTLEAWQRFLALYQAVMVWVREKKEFLKEQLHISTLQESRQKLHDYSVSLAFFSSVSISIV